MMRTRTLSGLLAACAFAAAASLLPSTPALAVHLNDTFELEGNVADDPAVLGDDWSKVYSGVGLLPNLLASVFADDPAPNSIFTGGGSKDDLDLNGPLSGAGGWKWKDGGVPDKDDITNAYAAGYNVNGQLVIYAGADRFDNSGDAFMGFWFFQSQIGLTNEKAGGGFKFAGQHTIGDVLVLANFTGGGTTVNIEVLEWVGTGGNVNGTLQRIAGIAGGVAANCDALGAGDLFCGRTNASTPGETPPWPYLSKDGTTSFPAATFFEIGINISAVFAAAGGGQTPCFSSFLAETRASSSVDATLKDFVLGGFPVCGIAVTKACLNPVLVGDSTVGYTVQGQVQNTGFGTLTNVMLSDAPRPLGAISYSDCSGGPIAFDGTLDPLETICYQSSFVTPVNGEDDTITASASAGSATVTAQATADCPNLQLSPAIDVAKQCSVVLAQVSPYLAVKVEVSGSVENIGDSPLFNVTVTDTDVPGNLLGPVNLAVGETKTFTASYFPSDAENRLDPPNTTLVPGLARFSDTVTATATAPLGASVQPDTATAQCTLCPTCVPDVCVGGVCPASSSGVTTSNLLKLTQ